jgi:hypothetical protein
VQTQLAEEISVCIAMDVYRLLDEVNMDISFPGCLGGRS